MSEPIESTEEEIIGGTISEGAKARETRELVQFVDGVIKKNVVVRTNFASCGHIVRSMEAIGGKCQVEGCRNIPCSRCFRLCARCGKGLCNSHQKLRKGEAFCNRCSWIVTFIGWRGSGFSGSQGSF